MREFFNALIDANPRQAYEGEDSESKEDAEQTAPSPGQIYFGCGDLLCVLLANDQLLLVSAWLRARSLSGLLSLKWFYRGRTDNDLVLRSLFFCSVQPEARCEDSALPHSKSHDFARSNLVFPHSKSHDFARSNLVFVVFWFVSRHYVVLCCFELTNFIVLPLVTVRLRYRRSNIG